MQRKDRARIELTRNTRAEDFRAFYWLKRELQHFCRQHGLSAGGSKPAITARIAHFLHTGERLPALNSRAVTKGAQRPNAATAPAFTMDARAPAGLRCTQELRRFFEAHLGKAFRFTVSLQNFMKDNPGVSFGDIAREWERQEALRRAGVWKPPIAPQFEYNRFTRDFYADPRNKGKTRQDCLDAWKRARARRGDHDYRSDDTDEADG